MNNKAAVSAVLIVTTIVLGSYIILSSSSYVEAQRIIATEGDLYRASDVFGSKRLTYTEDIGMLFEERSGKMLIGKGLEGGTPQSSLTYGTRLYLLNNGSAEEKAITDKLVDYALFAKHDENIIYYLTREGEIYQYDNRSGEHNRVAIEATIPDISPNGKSLVYLKAPSGWTPGQYYEGTPGLVVLNLETGEERILTKPEGEHLSNDYAPQWTPDGKHVIFFNNGLWIVNADGTGRTQLTKPGDGTRAYGISDDPLWSSDGRYFLYHSDYDIILVELDISDKRVITAGPIAYGVEPRWVEEGKMISVLSPDSEADASALSVVDLNGRVLRGDRSREDDYYRSWRGAAQRVIPRPVRPELQEEEIIREIPSEQIRMDETPQFRGTIPPESVQVTGEPTSSDVPRKVPRDAFRPITR